MKKIIYGLGLMSMLLPSLAFASWWNPFTWFHGTNISVVTPAVTLPIQPPTPPVVKSVPKKIKLPVKKVAVPIITPTIPAPVISRSNPPATIDALGLLDKVIADLDNDTAQAEQLKTQMTSDYQEFFYAASPSQASSFKETVTTVTSKLNVLEAQIDGYRLSLTREKQDITQLNEDIDTTYWTNVRIPDLIANQSVYKQQLIYPTSLYAQALIDIKKDIAAQPPKSATVLIIIKHD